MVRKGKLEERKKSENIINHQLHQTRQVQSFRRSWANQSAQTAFAASSDVALSHTNATQAHAAPSVLAGFKQKTGC